MFNLFGRSSTPSVIEQINVHRFEEIRANESDVVILDVRTPQENSEGAVPDSLLIDINGMDFAEKTAELDPSKTYLVYCRSGMRSMKACSYLESKGFTKLYNLAGGFIAWSQETLL